MSSAVIYLTSECNIRCTHCFVGNDQLRPRVGLTTDEVVTVLGNLSAGGISDVTLLGGEPTMRKDFVEIIFNAERFDLNVSVNTNLVSSAALLRALDHKSINNIVVSLDGITPGTHDKIRGRGSFSKTIANLDVLKAHPRVQNGSVSIDMTFVLNAINRNEVTYLVDFCKNKSFNKINFKTLQYNDRSNYNYESLSLSGREFLDAISEFYITCLISNNIIFEMFIPPALGMYLDQLCGLPDEFWNYNGCGGSKIYSYVDNYGNNIPCPAMSLEENGKSNLRQKREDINLVLKPLSKIRERSLFKGFDLTVKTKTRNANMAPCNQCCFIKLCSPCTNEVIRGSDTGTVYECHAVFSHGDERIPGIKNKIFTH